MTKVNSATSKSTIAKGGTSTKNSKFREWFITINNPLSKGYTHEKLKEIIATTPKRDYWCMCDEKGLQEETYHTHIYLKFVNPVAFNSMRTKFEGGHLDAVHGQPQQVRDYIMKSGKWENHPKVETKIEGTQEEWGVCPLKRQGQRTDLNFLYAQIACDTPTAEIIENNPKFMLRLTEIERVRQMLLSERFKTTFRHLDVTYIWGDSGTGKTRGVMEEYGYDKVFRITNYEKNPFDYYQGQDVLVLEEFRSSFKIQDMLNFLDGYPLQLPCRYTDKTACYTKVYIITNIPFEQQYETMQKTQRETWEAFKRRIHHFEEYRKVSDTEVKVIKTEAKEYYEAKDNEPVFK